MAITAKINTNMTKTEINSLSDEQLLKKVREEIKQGKQVLQEAMDRTFQLHADLVNKVNLELYLDDKVKNQTGDQPESH